MKCVKMHVLSTMKHSGRIIRVTDEEAHKLVKVYGFAERYATKKEWKEDGKLRG